MSEPHLASAQRNADISQSLYALHTRQLFDVVDEIRDIGGQIDLELPRIVVIGNQSAGKSSLIEAIARINVPRGSNTTTRCPMEVRLRSSSDPWQCDISLRYSYDEYGSESSNPIIVKFGPTLTDPKQVDAMLRRAQAAILNDAHDATPYLAVNPMQLQESDFKRQFSKNAVCIAVSGPELTDLTFVDLPGIIQHHATDPSLVDLVKSMVRENINDPAALILCTITMKDDPENQAALSEAKKADPDGKRTIGVLTKPDTLQTGEEAQWIAVLKNEGKHRLNLGYYITKQRTQEEVKQDISFEEARRNEVAFFQAVDTWRNLPNSVREHVGTARLTFALSSLLSERIRDSLPDIFNTINESLLDIDKGLRALGSGPSTNPIADTIGLCNRFRSILQGYVLGDEGFEALVQSNNAAFADFKRAIRSTAPVFLPHTQKEVSRNGEYIEPADILEDLPVRNTAKKFDLQQVRKNIKDASTRELPFNVPYAVKVRMMLLPIKDWQKLVDQCFGKVHPDVTHLVESITEKVFGGYDQTSLILRIRDLVTRQLAILVGETQVALRLLVNMEAQGPATQNLHYFSAIREKLIAHYRNERRLCVAPPAPIEPHATEDRKPEENDPYDLYPPSRAPSPVGSMYRAYRYSPPRPAYTPPIPPEPPRKVLISQVISNLALLGYSGITENDLAKLSTDDEWAEEITVMAETRAYFQVAYKRIIDTVPQAIDFVFVRPLAESLHKAIIAGLDFDSPDAHERCRGYLAESAQKAQTRRRLHEDKERLEKARKALEAIGFGS